MKIIFFYQTFGMRKHFFLFQIEMMAVMENSTSALPYEWEYYYDYLDPVIVDESKLKYNKCKFIAFIEFFVCFFLCYMITSNFLSPSRLNCYYILDYSGCFCGIPLSQFESNVSQWELDKVSAMHQL